MPSPISTGPTIMRCTLLMPQHAIVPGSIQPRHVLPYSVFCAVHEDDGPSCFRPKVLLADLSVKWLQLVWRHHHPLIIARQNSNELKITWQNVVGSRRHRSIFCSQVIKCDDNTQEHNESAGANLFWRKPKKIWSYSALYEDNTPHMCTTLMLENKIIEHCVKW